MRTVSAGGGPRPEPEPEPREVREIPREMQRFVIAVMLILGFLAAFAYVFHATRDVELAKTVLTVLAGALSAVVGYFFGSKGGERALEVRR